MYVAIGARFGDNSTLVQNAHAIIVVPVAPAFYQRDINYVIRGILIEASFTLRHFRAAPMPICGRTRLVTRHDVRQLMLPSLLAYARHSMPMRRGSRRLISIFLIGIE